MPIGYREKILIIALIFATLVFSGCDKSISPKLDQKSLYGTWSWLKSVGGITGEEKTPKSVGYNLFYVFKTDSTFELYKLELPGGKTLEIKCKFWVAKEKWTNYSDSVEILYYQNNQIEPQRIEFLEGNDWAVLHDLCIDCFDNTLVRID